MKAALLIETTTGARHVVNLDTKAGRDHAARCHARKDESGRPIFVESDEEPAAHELDGLPEDDGTDPAADAPAAAKRATKRAAK